MKSPIKIELETVATGKKEIRKIPKTDFPAGYRSDLGITEYLGKCFAAPNFRWKFVD